MWQYYFMEHHPCDCRWIPVGVVLTMAGTGSEMNSGSVISSHREEQKLFDYFRNPDFAILNPEFTYSVPEYQMVAGIYDIMSHILEQYLSGNDDNTSDYIAEGLMRSLIVSSRKAKENPKDYEARSNIMWAGMVAHNDICGVGREQDWGSHQLEHELSALYDVAHGAGLAVMFPAWLKYNIKHDVMRYAQFATRVWGCQMNFENPEITAREGIVRFETFLKSIGMPVRFHELGARKEDIPTLISMLKLNGRKADICPELRTIQTLELFLKGDTIGSILDDAKV